jgi:hypothetical protein
LEDWNLFSAMGHVRGHQLPIQNGTQNFRFSSGYENVPVWTGNEGIFQNNARNLTRKFQEAVILQEATTMGQLQRKEEKLTLTIHLTSTMDFLLQGDWKIVPVAHGALTTT